MLSSSSTLEGAAAASGRLVWPAAARPGDWIGADSLLIEGTSARATGFVNAAPT